MTISEQMPSRISVLLVTYNHENYIRQALDSLFGQMIEGPIELIIADDASSDRTVDVVKEYEGKDDRFRFKYLDNAANLGITKNYQRGFASCSSEYVAVLEGDDYWVSPFKLQRQKDFLDVHWECDLCSVNYFVFEEKESNFFPRTTVGNGNRMICAKELIADNIVGNFSTCMYRKTALENLPLELFEIVSYDWIVNICVARKSMIGFINEPMSVYRVHSKGVWSQESRVDKIKAQLQLIPAYDDLTNHVYHSDFKLLSKQLRRMLSISYLPNSITAQTRGLNLGIVDYFPPVLLIVIRALLPPIIKRLISRVIR